MCNIRTVLKIETKWQSKSFIILQQLQWYDKADLFIITLKKILFYKLVKKYGLGLMKFVIIRFFFEKVRRILKYQTN